MQYSNNHLRPVMLAGTGSDVGKSMLAAGLCRIFLQDGYRPAPFKAQNMALNSFATPDGREIGRAQAVQAEAAGIPCSTDMNPILLKPSTDMTSQVVVNGVPVGNRKAGEYFRRETFDTLRREAHAAFDRLNARFNPIVMEGAGSITELNLRDTDIVNMPMARYADAAVLLVADIDRGGVFASAYGSVMLQTPEDRRRIKGIIINKFRGDINLFDKGRAMLEEICGVPVIGVVPFARDIHIEEEDSVSVTMKGRSAVAGKINVAVLLLSHMANFTDFDALEHDTRVNLYYTATPAELLKADIIIIPGSKSTIDDMRRMRDNGCAEAVLRARRDGKTIMGICGGYQMMGLEVADPDGVEGEPGSVCNGLGLLPVRTILTSEKVTRQVRFTHRGTDAECEGYEIHMGVTERGGDAVPLNRFSDGTDEGCMADSRTFGTYIHGILDNRAVTDMLLEPYLDRTDKQGAMTDYRTYRESQYDAWADLLRESLDIPLLYDIMTSND